MSAPTRADLERVATRLWGPVNREQSSRDELRFGTDGSKSLDLRKRVFYDHEANRGGGWQQLYIEAGEAIPHGDDDIVATYDYRDEHGTLLFQVVRKLPKEFVQRRPDPAGQDGWIWNTKGIRRVLYHLPELLAADLAQPVFIAEGEKDADNLRALGLVATCNPGGSGKWRREYCDHLRDRDVVILPDNDEAGRAHAASVRRLLTDWARSIHTVVLPGLPAKGDISSWIAAGGTADALRGLVAAAAANGGGGGPGEPEISEADAGAEIARLARLPLLKYEQQRTASAKLLGLRPSILDKLVALERGDGGDSKGQGRPLDLPLPERWPQSVDGAALLNELADYFADHLVLPERAKHAIALWVVHCHCFDMFRFTPRLQFKSPVKGSGKSTAIELVKEVVPRPLEVETVSVAFLFRAIELIRPTVLMDEADGYLRSDKGEELRGLVNAGVKAGGQAGRCVGDNQEPRMFSCHAPAALAGIGGLPDTVEDRSIQIMMRRRARGEPIEPIEDVTRELGERLCRQAARWVADHAVELRDARPDMGTLFNRTADRWRALYAVAAIAGGDWPDLAREAVRAIADVAGDEAASLGEQLLADIRKIFNEEFAESTLAPDAIALTPDALVERLIAMLNRPWPEMGKSRKPLTKNALARRLIRFGVAVHVPWDAEAGKTGARVYRLIDFDDAFGRYLDS